MIIQPTQFYDAWSYGCFFSRLASRRGYAHKIPTRKAFYVLVGARHALPATEDMPALARFHKARLGIEFPTVAWTLLPRIMGRGEATFKISDVVSQDKFFGMLRPYDDLTDPASCFLREKFLGTTDRMFRRYQQEASCINHFFDWITQGYNCPN